MNRPKINHPIWFLIAQFALPLLHFLMPGWKIVPTPWNAFGILFTLMGFAINLMADRLLH